MVDRLIYKRRIKYCEIRAQRSASRLNHITESFLRAKNNQIILGCPTSTEYNMYRTPDDRRQGFRVEVII